MVNSHLPKPIHSPSLWFLPFTLGCTNLSQWEVKSSNLNSPLAIALISSLRTQASGADKSLLSQMETLTLLSDIITMTLLGASLCQALLQTLIFFLD